MGNYQNTRHHKGPREMVSGGEWLFGRNTVEEALAAERRTASEIILPPAFDNEDDQIQRIRDEARARRLVMRTMERKELDKLTHFGHHQGVALKVSLYPYVDFTEILDDASADENALVLVLDHLEDPQNVGAILRTACAAGVTGVVIPEDRACGITPAVARASSGGSEYVKVAKVVNLPRAMKELKETPMWFTALDWGEDSRLYTDIDFTGRTGLVIGAEGRGVSRLVRSECDFVAELPMPGKFESLNAGVAAAIAMYEVLRQRKG